MKLSLTARSLAASPMRSAVALALASCLLWGLSSPARANDDAGAPAEMRQPLPPLPKAPSTELAAPDPKDLEDLDALLLRVRSKDRAEREEASREVLEAPPHWVSAIAHRIDAIADAADRGAMRLVLENARRRGREEERKRMRAEGLKGSVQTPDYLVLLVEYAQPSKKAWTDLIGVVAMSRMLVQIGNIQAARTLIHVYVRFGEFLRVDTQKNLTALGDTAVAALIEATHHKADKIAHWASRQLDTLGKGIPGEAVQTDDYPALADILRAYGRIRDPDAARIVISFANSERALIREASRQSVVLMGHVAIWQLRDIYENTVGKRPPREWTWERTARELFAKYDRLRLSRVVHEFEAGAAARSKGDLEAMRSHWDKVLTQSPRFDRRGEMAEGYLEYAERFGDDKPDAATLAVWRAERIADDDAIRKRAASLRLTLQAAREAKRGVVEGYLLRRALELDPNNQRALALKRQLQTPATVRNAATGRYAAAGAIGAVALLAIGFIGLWRGQAPWQRWRRPKPEAPPAEDSSSDGSETSAPESQPAEDSSSDGSETSAPEPQPPSDGSSDDAPEPEPPRDEPPSDDAPTAEIRADAPSLEDAPPPAGGQPTEPRPPSDPSGDDASAVETQDLPHEPATERRARDDTKP